MSYVNKKTRAFRDVRDVELIRKRSDGRMKTYPSATDARCWVDNTEQKRQYILELVSRQGDGKGLSLGKFIPIEAIIDILLANKNAEIKSLQDEIEELKRFIKTHGLEASAPPRPKKTKADGGTSGKAGEGTSAKVPGGTPGKIDGESSKKNDGKSSAKDDGKSSAEVGGKPSTKIGKKSSATVDRKPSEQVEEERSAAVEEKASEKADGGRAAIPPSESKQMEKRDSEYPDEKMDREKEDESVIATPINYETEPATESRGDESENVGADVSDLHPLIDDESEVNGIADRSLPTSPTRQLSADERPSTIEGDQRPIQSTTQPPGTDSVVEKPSSVIDRTPTKEEVMDAAEFLSVKSWPQQVDDLKKALAERDKQWDLALAAIEQLENIKDIAEDRNERNPRWSERPGGKPGEAVYGDENGPGEQETDNLKNRLTVMRGLEDQVNALKMKLGGADGELEKLRCRCNDDEKSMKNMEKELDKLRCKLRECEILRCERDCLKCRVEDLMRVQRDYEELLRKTKGFDAIKAECCKYKTMYEELKGLENELNELRAKNEKYMQMEEEKELLMQEIRDCECCMSSQESEIKRLACHIECLTKDLDKRQDEMKSKVVTMRACLQSKDDLISSSEQKLAVVQDQLRSSIENVSVETTNLRNRIAELELQLAECKKANCTCHLQAEIDELKIENCRLNTVLANMGDEHVHKMLRHANKAMECLTERLNAGRVKIALPPLPASPAPSPISVIDDDELLKKIQALQDELNLAKQTIDTLQSAGDGGVPDQTDLINSLRKRISELEDDLALCKSEASQLKNELGNMKSVLDENMLLRKNSADLQGLAKDQLDKMEADNDALRKKLADLQRELDNEMKLRGIAEEMIKEQAAAAGPINVDAETEKLKALNDNLADELARLKDELARLKDEHDKLNNEHNKLISDYESIKAQLEPLNRELSKLKDELDKKEKELSSRDEEMKFMKDEINRQKQQLSDADADKLSTSDADRFAKEREELLKQIEAQKKEIGDMLNKMTQPVAADDSGRKELEGKQQEVDKLKSLIDDLEKQLKACKESAAAAGVPKPPDLNDIINNLTKRLDSEEKRTRDLEDQLKKCREENEKLRKQRESAPAHRASDPAQVKKPEQQRPPSPVKKVEPQRPASPVKKIDSPRPSSPVKKAEPQRPLSPVKKAEPQRPASPVKKPAEPQRPSSPVKKAEPQRPASPVKKPAEPQRPASPQKPKESPKSPVKPAATPPPKPKADDCEERLKKLEALMAAQKQQYEQTIAALKEQYEQDKKAILAQNKASIEKLQKSQENITKELEEKHDKEVAGIKEELKEVGAKPPSIINVVKVKKSPPELLPTSSPPQPQDEEPPEKITVVKPPIVTEDDIKPPVKEPQRKSILAVTPEVCPCGRLPTILPIPTLPSDHEFRRPSSIPPPTWLQRPPPPPPQPMEMPEPQFRSAMMGDPLFESSRIAPQPQPRVCSCKGRHSSPERARPQNEGVIKDNEDKLKSIKKIAELENKLLNKQLQTKQKVDLLQTTVDRFKRELEREKQKNSDLSSRYANQSKTVENMMMEINLVKQENITDKKKLHQLNTTLKTLERDMHHSGTPPSGDIISNQCICARIAKNRQRTSLPHFHTEVMIRKEEGRSANRKTCNCSHPSSTYSSDIDE